MKLKVDKDYFLSTVQAEVEMAVKNSFYVTAPNYYGEQVSVNFNDLISKAVAQGVMAAMEYLVDSQYTDDDFEKDIGLKP